MVTIRSRMVWGVYKKGHVLQSIDQGPVKNESEGAENGQFPIHVQMRSLAFEDQGGTYQMRYLDSPAGQNLAKPDFGLRRIAGFLDSGQIFWILTLDSTWIPTWMPLFLDYNPGIRLYVEPCWRVVPRAQQCRQSELLTDVESIGLVRHAHPRAGRDRGEHLKNNIT